MPTQTEFLLGAVTIALGSVALHFVLRLLPDNDG
jgi:hypothetical protein